MVTYYDCVVARVQDVAHQNVNKDLERQQSFLDKMRVEVRCVQAVNHLGGAAQACLQQ